MEIMIELTDAQLKEVAGGFEASASFSFTNSASGTTATVTGSFSQLTSGGAPPTASASQSGTFSSSST
jgi:hypothetical protein